jgi:hypothetical protein
VWAGIAVALAAAVLFPASAAAHGLVGRADLPIPEWLFGWAAAVVLVVSFVALATLWPKPQLEDPHERPLFRVPVALDVICGAIGIVVFAVVVYAGFAGTQAATSNLAPTVIYVLFWVGLPVISVFLGDVFRAFNPWLALARGVSWIVSAAGAETPEPLEYPRWLGRWPAAAGILIFAWVELAYSNRDAPQTLAIMALAYAAFQLLGMAVYGIERWSTRADAFGVYFGLFARLSAFTRRGREVFVRRFLSGAPALERLPGTVALLLVMVGSTTFDGFSMGTIWTSMTPDIQKWFVDLGMNLDNALEATFTVGLIGAILFVSAIYNVGIAGMRLVGRPRGQVELARTFAHTLVPIAFAYVLAHYFSLLIYQGQATAYLVSDPLGNGSDLFGTANVQIDYNVITATGIWYVQVAALVLGHVAGLVLAHDRALVIYDDVRDATRSQYWMLAVMVCFTSLGLWLLSAANG